MKTVYVMQVKIWKDGKECWEDVRPSGGKRYEYDTQAEADKMLRICYGAPEHSGKARVIPVESSVQTSVFEGCVWVFHDGSHCGKPICGRYKDMCEIHGMLVC